MIETDSEEILNVFGDRCARLILCMVSEEPRSIKDISQECNKYSLTTVYRRINKLEEHGLIEEIKNVEKNGNGNGNTKYKSIVDSINISLVEEGFQINIVFKQNETKSLHDLFKSLEIGEVEIDPDENDFKIQLQNRRSKFEKYKKEMDLR